ncbi:MAG: hypothetical protein AAGU73_07915 [Actinomycetota bacterium]
MDAELRMWRWDVEQLILSDIRADAALPSWKAVLIEGTFLPSDSMGTYIGGERLDPFVGDLLWRLKTQLEAELLLTETHDTKLIVRQDDLERSLQSMIGETGYMLVYRREGATLAVAFDIDIEWLAILSGEATIDAVEEGVRSSAIVHARRLHEGP